jgi:hypothetical protein
MAIESISSSSISAPNESGPLWLRLGYRYGFPAAVAAFLLYFVTQVMASDQRAVLEEARKANINLDAHVRDMNATRQLDVEDRARLSRQLHGLCMVVADGDPISERWCQVGQ